MTIATRRILSDRVCLLGAESMSFFERHVREHFHPAFFEDLTAAIDAACASAHVRSGCPTFLAAHQAYVEGNDRHYAIQEVLTRLSVKHGAQGITLRAGTYPIAAARHGHFLLTACVADNLKKLERSKARRLLAALNGAVEPFQPDLFATEAQQNPFLLSAMIIVARAHGDELPSAIYLGVPTSSLKGWHFYQEISDLFRLYDEVGTVATDPLVIKRPRLRHIPRSRTHRRSGE